MMKTFSGVVKAMTIPSEVACDAMNGGEIRLAAGAAATFFQDVLILDSCATPMDSLHSKFRKMPLFKDTAIFTDGTF